MSFTTVIIVFYISLNTKANWQPCAISHRHIHILLHIPVKFPHK